MTLAGAVLFAPALTHAQSPPPATEPPPMMATEPPPAATPPPPPPPGVVSTANKGSLTFKGFVSATIFAQDTTFTFGDGQNAQFPSPTRDKGDDPWFIDGDVRNTRLNLTWDGPTGGALPKLGAVVEADFFGGFAAGSFGNAAPIPRLRIAAASIALGTMTLKIGQDWAPLFGNVPVSLAHMAFPLGYGSAGTIGWRFPGIWLIVPLSEKEAEVQLKLTLAVLRNSWALSAMDPQNAGSTGIPQIEARFDASTKMWSAYVVGHFDSKDLDTRGDEGADSMTAFAVEAGAKLTSGPLMVQANGYFGQNIAHQFGNLFQFGSDDISGFGVWGQVGYEITPEIAIYGFFGIDKPNEDDVKAAVPVAATPRLQNIQAAGMIRWKQGPYQLGLEYLFDQLKFTDAMGDTDVSGSQIALSANYAF